MGQLSQGSGLSGNTVRGTAALFVGVLFREVSTVTWDAILVTVDGFGFGTLTGESCLKNVHCHTDRASWDAILVTVVAFGALMWDLGRVGGGGGIPLGGGGGRRTENRDHIYIYIYIYIHIHIHTRVIMKHAYRSKCANKNNIQIS